jgi:RNA polymerase sigma factor (sigma-70 family)
VDTHGGRLRRVLIAHYGLRVGPDAAADALAWAWEHWDRVRQMRNPVGYLYRVGQSAARRHRRGDRRVVLPPERLGEASTPTTEPLLDAALASLKPRQRVAVLLVHGLDWTYADAAHAMGITVSAIRNHVHRGLKRLRRELGDAE